MRYLTLILTSAAVLAWSGCSGSTNAAGLSDDEIESAINNRFEADIELRETDLEVDADIEDGEITLSGTVSSPELHRKARDIVAEFQPELALYDEVEVEAPPEEVAFEDYTDDMAAEERLKAESMGETLGDSLQDAWIHTKLTTQLLADPDTTGFDINVDVVDTAVTLRGEVETAEAKAEAERIARETDGVTSVTNQLTVMG